MSNRKLAKQCYKEKNYRDAANYLMSIYRRNRLKDKDAPMLADCLYRLQQEDKALEIYQYMEDKKIDFDQTSKNQYFISMLNDGSFQKAYQWFYRKDTVVDNSVFADNKVSQIEKMNMVNSQHDEYGITPFESGIMLLSTQPSYSFIAIKNSEGNNFPQPYYAQLAEDGSLVEKQNYDFPFWSKASFAGFTLFDQGKKMILSAIPFSGKEKNYSLFYCEKNGNKQWELKQKIDMGEGNFIQPFYHEKEDKLYFVADLQEGSGTDIFYCHFKAEQEKPVITHMSDQINTLGNELYPIIYQDSLLIFASNGHYGLGGLDLYQVNLKNKPCQVKNMGPPLNSPFDDYSIIFYPFSRFGFFTSNRNSDVDDIFKFYLK
jgi:hypothetical protein